MAKKITVRSDVPKEPALIIENQLILKPGVWNGVPLTAEEIKKGVESNTDWSDKRNCSIYYGHDPKKQENWVGNYSNRRYLTLADGVEEEGFYADLNFYDTDLASKLAYGKAKMAVSQGMDYAWGRTGPYDIKFNHLGIVSDPGCRDERLFLNLENTELVEGERYSTEARYELNLNLEDSHIIKKEDKKMTEENKNPNVDINKEVLKSTVDQIILEKEQSQKAEAEKKAAEESKRIADEEKIKSEVTKVAEETAKKVVNNLPQKESISREEFDSLNKKLDEIFSIIKEPVKVSEPKTVAVPLSDNNAPINESQSDIAKRLVDTLSK